MSRTIWFIYLLNMQFIIRLICLLLLGHFSRFFIQSVTSHGEPKTVGGDSWRVYIRQGPSSLAPVVFDLNNGVYEVLFLVLEPGSYTAQIWLDFTLCDGFRDPPVDWFVKGKSNNSLYLLFLNHTIEPNIIRNLGPGCSEVSYR